MSLSYASSASKAGMISVPMLAAGEKVLSYTLDALIEQGHASLVASPTLLTQNRTVAVIEAGEEVPYQEKTGTGNTSVTFKKAVLREGNACLTPPPANSIEGSY